MFASLRRTALPLFVLLTACLLAACNPKLDWRDFTAEDGGFTLLMPQKPGQSEHRFATPMGTVTMKMYTLRIDETALGAGYADFAAPLDAQAMDVMRDALVRSLGGTLVSETPVTSPGQPGLSGREILVKGRVGSGAKGEKGPAAELRARLYARDKRYFQVVLAGREGGFAADDADMFLKSFKPI